jgi:hypothetical protein
MHTLKRAGLVVLVGGGGGLLLLLAWFYATVPEPPTPPSDLAARTPADTAVELPDVRAELLRMKWVDQQIRRRFADSLRAGRVDGLSGLVRALRYSVLESRVDERNTARLKDLVANHGWPHEGRVGPAGAEAAFLIAQHADHDPAFQKTALEHVRTAHRNGQASGEQVALLTDRVRVAEGTPQLYGTQAQIRDGTLQMPPIQDSSAVDQRRARMGLPPLSDYIDTLRAQYR